MTDHAKLKAEAEEKRMSLSYRKIHLEAFIQSPHTTVENRKRYEQMLAEVDYELSKFEVSP